MAAIAIPEGRQPDGPRSAPKGYCFGDPLAGHKAEPAEHQAITDALRGFTVMPIVEVFDAQEPQDGLDEGRVPVVVEGSRIAPDEFSTDLKVEHLIVQRGGPSAGERYRSGRPVRESGRTRLQGSGDQ